LFALKQIMPTKMQLAREAIHIEQEILKENVGCQDQILASFGGLNRIDFRPDQEIRVSPIIISQQRLEEIQNHLLLYFTGFSRIASEIAKEQIECTKDKKSELLCMFQMVQDAVSILTGGGDLSEFGMLLDESWKLKRSLTSRISSPVIDDIYEMARSAGAIGGKLLGAGGGGFMLLFAKPEDHGRIRATLNQLLRVPFRFENTGSQIILYQPDTLWERDYALSSYMQNGAARSTFYQPEHARSPDLAG
jgi:D-glycero-alpha-D-manno-heptose-7-phosphate kinase